MGRRTMLDPSSFTTIKYIYPELTYNLNLYCLPKVVVIHWAKISKGHHQRSCVSQEAANLPLRFVADMLVSR